MKIIEKLAAILAAALFTVTAAATLLPDLMPYLAGLFAMAIVARVVWFYTR